MCLLGVTVCILARLMFMDLTAQNLQVLTCLLHQACMLKTHADQNVLFICCGVVFLALECGNICIAEYFEYMLCIIIMIINIYKVP